MHLHLTWHKTRRMHNIIHVLEQGVHLYSELTYLAQTDSWKYIMTAKSSTMIYLLDTMVNWHLIFKTMDMNQQFFKLNFQPVKHCQFWIGLSFLQHFILTCHSLNSRGKYYKSYRSISRHKLTVYKISGGLANTNLVFEWNIQ